MPGSACLEKLEGKALPGVEALGTQGISGGAFPKWIGGKALSGVEALRT